MNGSAASSLASSSIPVRPVVARTRMLLEAPIGPTLLRLAAPNVLNLLAFVGLITFDGIFVGRLGADPLAGVSLAFPFVMFMQHAAASGMGGGVSPAASQARAFRADDEDRARELGSVYRELYGHLLKRHEQGRQRALRVKVNERRQRLWILALDSVHVYDITKKRLIRRIPSPDWSIAGLVCPSTWRWIRPGPYLYPTTCSRSCGGLISVM